MCQKSSFLHQKGNFNCSILLAMGQLPTFSPDLADTIGILKTAALAKDSNSYLPTTEWSVQK